MINLPELGGIDRANSVLIAGAGGGFDVFCGLPIYFAMRDRGQSVHLANFSFTHLEYLKGATTLSPTLFRLDADIRSVLRETQSVLPYAPELHLSHWFREKRQQEVPVWCFAKMGAEQITRDYQILVDHLAIDAILLIDGGVDSLMRGNEAQLGTPVEDSLTLLAVRELEPTIPAVLACIGMGAERDISYGHVLENIAQLTQSGDFLGTCSLRPQDVQFQAYEEAIEYVHERTMIDQSVINASVISAARGQFDDYHLIEKTHGSRLWISPFMSIYWFFNASGVIKRSMLLDDLIGTRDFRQALHQFIATRKNSGIRHPKPIGLSS